MFVSLCVVVSAEEESEEEEVNKKETLCERPIINAADRMTNNTVRLYRGRYYWNLNGLPAASGTVDGPYELPFNKMGQIFRNNTVVTLLGGTDRGKTVKTEGKNYWLWDEKGNLKTEATGLYHNRLPTGGFEAAFHDGNMDDPTLIGFQGIKSYYFSTRYRVWTIDNKPSGYIGGKYNESFPIDLSAAFTYPATNPKDGYIAYFFKRDKYCKRTKFSKSGKDCDEWLQNKSLFGCDGGVKERTVSSKNADSGAPQPTPQEGSGSADGPKPSTDPNASGGASGGAAAPPDGPPPPAADGSNPAQPAAVNLENTSPSAPPETTRPTGGSISITSQSSVFITIGLALIQFILNFR